MANIFQQLRDEFQDAQSQFGSYLQEGIPEDPEFDRDAQASIQSLYELAQKLKEEGNITPMRTQEIVQALVFTEKLARAVDDIESARNLSFLIVELNDFITTNKTQDNKPAYLRGLDL